MNDTLEEYYKKHGRLPTEPIPDEVKECKDNNISHWDISTIYTEPTKVLYNGKICIVEGIGIKPLVRDNKALKVFG